VRAAVVLSVVIAARAFVSAGDDGSARRYAIIETNEVVCKYFLLSMKEVQTRLNLTQAQIKSLESAMLAPPASNPGIAEVRRSQAQLLAAAATDEERSRIRRAGHEKASEITHLGWATTLQDTLSTTQRLALSELILQMTGPHAIVGNTEL